MHERADTPEVPDLTARRKFLTITNSWVILKHMAKPRPSNTPARRAATMKWRAKRRAWLREIREERGCLDCGGHNRLEFDHREPSKKLFTIGWFVSLSMERLLAEIEKCDVVCRKCHAKRGSLRRNANA
jgi:hypothetical protein